MNFDSIVPLLFILAFFLVPSILRQIRARKKKAGKPQPVKKRVSIFDRINEQIQKFVQELEQQGGQQKAEPGAQANIWDVLAEDEPQPSAVELETGRSQEVPAPEPPVLKKAAPALKSSVYQKDRTCPEEPVQRRSGKRRSGACRLKSRSLQNAIVWSEILSKPLALRDK